ncbi:DNA-directed RNA polymerase subunit RPB1 [uncultured virus]|nr:DNA-directed RNA polymerase subunit RPB1 [uncultured virus]
MNSNNYVYQNFKYINKIDFNIFKQNEKILFDDKDYVGIDIPDLYDNMEPKRGGLIDSRLGSTDHYIDDCPMCGLNSTFCAGHFGHINLVDTSLGLYDNMEIKHSGLTDTRLGGRSDNHLNCLTCGLNPMFCLGHFEIDDLIIII